MSKPFVNLHLQRALAVLDCETTGTAPQSDRIVEIAVVKFQPDGKRFRFHQRVNPGVPIPDAATAVHGITDTDVADCRPFEAVARDLVKFLKDCDLAGFGIRCFDLPLLLAEFRRAGVTFPLASRAVIDVLQLYQQRERRDLTAAVRHYLDRDHDGAHGALADAHATAAVLDAQLGWYPDLPRTVPDLHDTMTDVDLAGRFRRQDGVIVFAFGKYRGQPLDDVARRDPDYLQWIQGRDFLPDVQTLVARALFMAGQ